MRYPLNMNYRATLNKWLFGEERDFIDELNDPAVDLQAEYLKLSKRQDIAREIRRRFYYCPRYTLHQLPDDIRGRWNEGPRAFLPNTIQQKLMEQELNKVKKLTYVSPYVLIEGDETDVEGYLELQNGYYALDIATPATVDIEAKELWDCGEISQTPIFWGNRTLIVPGKALNEELIIEAIKRWYMERIEWRRSWWRREQKLPKITLHLHWEANKEPDGDPKEHERHLNEYNHQRKMRLFRRFGRTDEGPKPIRR